jgi:microcompartment protein CcmK/EutM
VDHLGAGPGELVLVAHGSRCRDLTIGEKVPTKDVILAIVDQAELTLSSPPGKG